MDDITSEGDFVSQVDKVRRLYTESAGGIASDLGRPTAVNHTYIGQTCLAGHVMTVLSQSCRHCVSSIKT